MAGQKLSGLSALVGPIEDTDEFYCVRAGASRRLPASQAFLDNLLVKASRGHVRRRLGEVLGDVCHVKNFGAIGDGVSRPLSSDQAAVFNTAYTGLGIVAGDENDYAAIKAAFQVATETGVPVYAPTGKYECGSRTFGFQVTYTDNPIFDQVGATKFDCLEGDGFQTQIHMTVTGSGRGLLELLGSSNGASVCAGLSNVRLYCKPGSHLQSVALRVGDSSCGIDCHRVFCHGANGALLKIASSTSYAQINSRFSQCHFWGNYLGLHWADETTCTAFSVKAESGGAFWDNVEFDTCLFQGTLVTRASICVVQNCQFVSNALRADAVGVPYSANVFLGCGKFESRSSYFEDHKYAIFAIDGEASIRGLLITGSHFSGVNNAIGAPDPTNAIACGNTGNFGFGLVTLINNSIYSDGYSGDAFSAQGCRVFEIGTHDLVDPDNEVSRDYSFGHYTRIGVDGILEATNMKAMATGALAIEIPNGGLTALDTVRSQTACSAPFHASTRVNAGGDAGGIWGYQVQNPGATNAMLWGWTSTDYTTGGPLLWAGNDQPILAMESGKTLRVGFGANALDFIEIGLNILYAPNAVAALGDSVVKSLNIVGDGQDYELTALTVINQAGNLAFNWQLSAAGHCDLYTYTGAAWLHSLRILKDGGFQIMLGGHQVKTGANSRIGTATLVGGTVTVNNTSVTANTRVRYWCVTPGGTRGHMSYTKVNATSFTLNSDNAADTSTYDWELVEEVP
jgi:hypothetical protein